MSPIPSPSPFRGSFTALVTPFRDGALDEKAFRAFVDWQIAEGTHGLVPVGTTGESPTLSHDEHNKVVSWAVEQAAGRVPVIAGAGSNNTAEAIGLATHAQKVGANALLVVTPYYNKPDPGRPLRTISRRWPTRSTSLPIFIYNIPGRSVIDMTVDTMARLFRDCKNIRGREGCDRRSMVRPLSPQRQTMLAPEFVQLSGEDGTALGLQLANGGHGCISVTANIAPRLCAEIAGGLAGKGDFEDCP